MQLLHQHRFRVLLFMFATMAVALGMIIVPFETVSAEANITNFWDGLWWSVTTMTGVGYGDYYPVTVVGRLIGMTLEVLGLVVFGLIVGQLAVALFRVKDDFYWKRLFLRIDDFEERLDRIEKSQKFMVKEKDRS